MSKSQTLFGRTLSKLGRSQEQSRARRRRPSRRLRAEALEARQLLAGDLFINEIMADNDTIIEDPDEAGAYEDWVEIYNAGTTAIDLGGKYLTDDVDAPTQWQFPAGSTIAAGDYLLIWADGETEQGDNHASFKLSASGETVALYDTDGTTLLDTIEFGAQSTDVAYGRSPDGSETLSVLTTPTPGAANSVVAEANFAPTANAGGPYYGTTADTISISGSKSADSDGTIATYAWDLDHDGEYDDATGVDVTFTSTTAGTFVVGLQVTDDDGVTSIDTGTIKISQVGDTASPWDPVTIDDEAAVFFDDTYVHEVYITFEDDDWYDTLFTSHDTDAADPYFEADFVADGIALDNVGVRFKGNSSFDGSGVKKSIKIDFNEFVDSTFLGLKKLNLNNNYNDPTMLREKLFYDYASNFVEGVGRAVFTNVYINGELYGVYTAVEQVDSTFTQSRFGDDEDGNLYKGTASDDAVLSDPQADFGSDLTYLGTDQAAYEAFYELKTNEAANDYSQLIELIDVLNNTPSGELADAIEPLLDVQDTLASLALNNLFVNLDSYSGAAHNYYLYDRDDTGQFTHLLWDANESFGTFTQFVDRFQNPVEIDPFWLPTGTAMGPPGTPVEDEPRPLAENLWAVDDYSIDYLRDLQQMLEEGFDVISATARINELADLIRDDVSADPNKQFTLAQFNSNLTTNVSAGNRTIYGLTSFIGDRSTYLASALSQYDLEPESVEVYINEIMADNDATIEDPDEAGAFEDWIELYNPGTTVVDLSGFYLTDDAADPTQWQFPSGSTIDAGGYLIIWADGDTDQGDNHASFKLSAGGESVQLYNNDGTTLVDSITFGEQTTDVSYGRFPDGSSTLLVLSAATPGASNTNDATPDNIAPTAEAGGPYTGTVGGTITLSGATSSDSDGTIASYAWDLDNDGLYDDATTTTATFNAAAAGTFTVGLQVTDDDGATSTNTATVTVNAAVTPGLVVTQSGGSTIVNEASLTDTINVALSSQPTADVTVSVTSADTDEAAVSPDQLTFTPDNWDIAQTVTISSSSDGLNDGSQSTQVSFDVSSTDAAYAAVTSVEVSVITHDSDITTPATRIYTPDFLVRLHVIPGDSIPTAILFRAVSNAAISVVPIGTASVGQTIRVVDETVSGIDTFSAGVTTATVTAGGLYAIIFEPHTENRTYTVQSTAGSDAFTPSAPTNFLQPTDTNGDARTSALDALIVINQISRMQNAEGEELTAAFMYDVNHDGVTTALDALMVINQLTRQTDATSESELVQSADQLAPLLSNQLATTTSENDDETAEYPLGETLADIDSHATLFEAAFASQSNAVSEFVFESDSDLSDDDLDLLAEDLHHMLSMQESSS
ncbi:CotH kinase family protein [Rubripirellula reticaptiva]|uniref:Inner spore coat protein H n=1 Tax=Rubripirellula reticaptiva TaxID=2528013 RepID=A0A5C6EHZ4_9BACT|nr:CotH kinase family protein [Rubripirellula reticaptiva]TWU48095.1 Inner spore coat protein H [Rubripirellula reticaptiva]